MPAVYIIAFFALFVGIMCLVGWIEHRRGKAWEALGGQLGLSYSKKNGGCGLPGHFKLYDRGHTRKWRYLLRGKAEDVDFVLGEFVFITGHGKHRSTHAQACCVLRLPGLALPEFHCRREHGVWDWLGEKLGGQDIDFAEDPQFSKGWVLQGADEAAVRTLFDRDLRRFFSQSRLQVASIEGQGGALLVNMGKRLKPAQVSQVAGPAFSLAAHLGQRDLKWPPDRA